MIVGFCTYPVYTDYAKYKTQSTNRGRVEIGRVYLLERRTPTIFYVMVDRVKGGGREPPTLTRLG